MLSSLYDDEMREITCQVDEAKRERSIARKTFIVWCLAAGVGQWFGWSELLNFALVATLVSGGLLLIAEHKTTTWQATHCLALLTLAIEFENRQSTDRIKELVIESAHSTK